jgi:hypothetical protein
MTSHKDLGPPFPYDILGYAAPFDALKGIDRNPELVRKLQDLFSEAGHVFKKHPEGVWGIPGGDKDAYAKDLNLILNQYPGVAGRLLKLDNRVIKMVTYRALELREAKSAEAGETS